MSARLLVFIALVLAAPPAGAMILASGDGSGNTSAPADDFGFANVGDAGQTAVYIGAGWVISANHVGVGPVVLEGVTYEALPGSKVRMRNRGARVSPDLAMFRLREVPSLPSLPIRHTPPEVGDLVFLAGHGYGRDTPVEFQGAPGWAWSDEAALRWGTNTVKAVGLMITVGSGNATATFETNFSGKGATEHEAQVALGDSGGGAFIERGDTWELAGVLFAASLYPGQAKRTSIRGNLTYIADLSIYRDQILAIMACDDDLECVREGRARRASSCTSNCGDGFAWSLVAALLVRPRFKPLFRPLFKRRWPSWVRLRRRPRAPS
jgi:hypothetical protein